MPDAAGVVRWVPELEVRRSGQHRLEARFLEEVAGSSDRAWKYGQHLNNQGSAGGKL